MNQSDAISPTLINPSHSPSGLRRRDFLRLAASGILVT